MSQSDTLRAPSTFVAFAVSTLFFGIVITQAVLYFRRYRRDRIFLKLLVSVITVLQLLQQILLSVNAWSELVNHGTTAKALRLLSALTLFVDAAIVAIAQMFYASRIWAFNPRSTKLVGTCCIFVLGNIALSIVLVVKLLSMVHVDEDVAIKKIFITINAVTWSTDVVLSAIFIVVLIQARTGSSVGNRLIHKVIRFIVNAGTVTVVWGIAALILLIRNPRTNVPALLYMTGTNSYTMSLLSSLISRHVYKPGDCENHRPIEVELPEFTNPGIQAFSTVEPQVSTFDESIKVSSEDPQQVVDG